MHTARGRTNTLDLTAWGGAGMQQLTPLWLLKYLPNMLACHVTIVHGLMGPSNTITCQEASSHLAIGEAFRTIQRGDADLAICGGAESKVVPMGLLRQCLLKRVTEMGNDNPAAAVRPFDADATGSAGIDGKRRFCSSSKEYEHAKKRGAKIYAGAGWVRCVSGRPFRHRRRIPPATRTEKPSPKPSRTRRSARAK